MTNGWTDIRNADVVLAMGGNPAENHPVGFRFVMEAKRNRNAKLVSRRSAIQSHGGGRGSLRPDPRRHRHRVSRRADPPRADAQPLSRRIRPPVHQRAVPRVASNTPSTRSAACSPDGTTSRRRTPTSRAGTTSSTTEGFAKVDPTLQHPRSVFQVMKRFYARYTPETGRRHLRLQRRRLREGGRAHHLDRTRRTAPARSCMRSAGRITATRCS